MNIERQNGNCLAPYFNVMLQTYIRNSIDHSDNDFNDPYTDSDFRKSIDEMIELLKKCRSRARKDFQLSLFLEQVEETTKIDFGRLLHKSREIDGFTASLAAGRKLPHIFRLRVIYMETCGDDGGRPPKPA